MVSVSAPHPALGTRYEWIAFAGAHAARHAAQIREIVHGRTDADPAAAMSLQRAEVVHTSIAAPPQKLIAWLRDMNTWKSWAPWIQTVTKSSPRDWTLATEAGTMKVHFVEPNAFGVLDHEVTLESGVTVLNSMRVLPNGSGSELVMVLFHRPQMTTDEFERDVQAVTGDFARLKQAAEAWQGR